MCSEILTSSDRLFDTLGTLTCNFETEGESGQCLQAPQLCCVARNKNEIGKIIPTHNLLRR